jgi:hypothetical protein
MHPLTRYPLNVARHHAGRLELRRSKRSLTARPRWNDWEDHGGRVLGIVQNSLFGAHPTIARPLSLGGRDVVVKRHRRHRVEYAVASDERVE